MIDHNLPRLSCLNSKLHLRSGQVLFKLSTHTAEETKISKHKRFALLSMLSVDSIDPQCNPQRKWRSCLENKICRWFNSSKNILKSKMTEHKITRKLEMAQQPHLTQSTLIQYQTQKPGISLNSPDLRSSWNCSHSKMPDLILFHQDPCNISRDTSQRCHKDAVFHNVKESEKIFLDLSLYLDPH